MHRSVDNSQIEAWKEEQYKVAAKTVIPEHSSFIIVDQSQTDDLSDEYRNRYKHCTVHQYFAHDTPLFIGGVDVAFPTDGSEQAIAVYVILRYMNFATPPSVAYRSHRIFVPPPYISSYLSFRESWPLLSLIENQLKSHPECRPNVIMVDGNGIWHERRAGLACFIGQCGIPCIGIGKSWYSLNGNSVDVKTAVRLSVEQWYRLYNEPSVKNRHLTEEKVVILDSIPFTDTCSSPRSTENTCTTEPQSINEMLSALHSISYGLALPMLDEEEKTLAYALLGLGGGQNRSSCGSKNPIYISIGNNITLIDAVTLVAYTCGVGRIPEPVRQSDLYGRILLRNNLEESQTEQRD